MFEIGTGRTALFTKFVLVITGVDCTYMDWNNTGLFLSPSLLWGPRCPPPPQEIATKLGTRLRNCTKERTSPLFLMKIAYLINYASLWKSYQFVGKKKFLKSLLGNIRFKKLSMSISILMLFHCFLNFLCTCFWTSDTYGHYIDQFLAWNK